MKPLTANQKKELAELERVNDVKFENSDAVVIGRGDWKKIKRALTIALQHDQQLTLDMEDD